MYCPHQGLNPGLTRLQHVAIVTTLSWSPPGWSAVNEIFTNLVINVENHTNYKKLINNYELYLYVFFVFGATAHSGPGPPHSQGF